MRWITRVSLACALVARAAASPTSPSTRRVILVPGDVPTLQQAIGASGPGHVVLLAPGVHPGEVVVSDDKHDLTIRGLDRTRSS
jgi:hypothetical protein